MSKRKRRGPNLDALERVAHRAARVLEEANDEPLYRHRRFVIKTPSNRAKLRRAVRAEPPITTLRKPRQLRLDSVQRAVTMQALEDAAGRPIGRVTRAKLRGRIPDVVYQTLCKRKRNRREVLFARKAAGKGRTKAARSQRKHQKGKC